jgi:hypothetical protein
LHYSTVQCSKYSTANGQGELGAKDQRSSPLQQLALTAARPYSSSPLQQLALTAARPYSSSPLQQLARSALSPVLPSRPFCPLARSALSPILPSRPFCPLALIIPLHTLLHTLLHPLLHPLLHLLLHPLLHPQASVDPATGELQFTSGPGSSPSASSNGRQLHNYPRCVPPTQLIIVATRDLLKCCLQQSVLTEH